MHAKIIGLIAGIVAAPVALFFAVVSGGAGHGDYFAARLLFPLPMLSTYLFREITLPAIAIARVQFPIYGWFGGAALKKEGRKPGLVILALHGLALAVIFIFPDSSLL